MEDNRTAEKKVEESRKNLPVRVSAPDQLTDYLRVTNPGVWVILLSVVLLLAGILVWAFVGTLETSVPVRISVTGNQAMVVPEKADRLAEGMPLRMDAGEYVIKEIGTDEYGRIYGLAEVPVQDGIYSGTVVTDRTRPISFLLESR